MGYIRLSQDGPNGAGKTCTAALAAVGLAIEYGDRRPVHVFDSSNRWRTWKKLIFDIERVPLVITYGESIAVLQKAMQGALDRDCSAFIADDLTVPWMEGIRAFSQQNGNLTFAKREQLLGEWNQFVSGFKHGPFDSLACGRLGYVWETIENAEGEEELHQGQSKFNAGGGQNFGYDAELELEIRRRQRNVLGFFRGKKLVEHVVDVRKDAHGQITSKQFVFSEWENGYKPGMYKPVMDAIRPHVDWVRGLDDVQFVPTSSRELIVEGRTDWARDQSNRKALLEEISATLELCFPSGEGKSKLAKMCRDLTLEYLNGFISCQSNGG